MLKECNLYSYFILCPSQIYIISLGILLVENLLLFVAETPAMGVSLFHSLQCAKMNALKFKVDIISTMNYGYVQWFSFENQQSPVYDIKRGHFDRVKSTFKMLLSS